MANPNRGVRAPLLDLGPPIAGRRSGTDEAMIGMGVGAESDAGASDAARDFSMLETRLVLKR
jgi:hypothetical protein